MKARKPTFILLTAIFFAFIPAAAEGSSIPLDLPGLNGAGAGQMQHGPIYTMRKKDPAACDDLADFTYTDSVAATAGLASYLKRRTMTFEELERTNTMVTWKAQSGYNELLGVWEAKAGGGGTLEMCALKPRHPLMSTDGGSTSGPSTGAYGFGGFGGLGLIMWFVRRRLLR